MLEHQQIWLKLNFWTKFGILPQCVSLFQNLLQILQMTYELELEIRCVGCVMLTSVNHFLSHPVFSPSFFPDSIIESIKMLNQILLILSLLTNLKERRKWIFANWPSWPFWQSEQLPKPKKQSSWSHPEHKLKSWILKIRIWPAPWNRITYFLTMPLMIGPFHTQCLIIAPSLSMIKHCSLEDTFPNPTNQDHFPNSPKSPNSSPRIVGNRHHPWKSKGSIMVADTLPIGNVQL